MVSIHNRSKEPIAGRLPRDQRQERIDMVAVGGWRRCARTTVQQTAAAAPPRGQYSGSMSLLSSLLASAAVAAASAAGDSSISPPAAVVHAGGKYTLTNVSDACSQLQRAAQLASSRCVDF